MMGTLATVLAGMAHPFYSRLRKRCGGRSSLAAGITVALSLVIVIIPLLLFVGVLVGEAVSVSEGAARWFTEQVGPTGELRTKLAEDPDIQRLLPYQDEIIAKISQMTAKAGSFVAQGLALGARGTAEFLLLVFVLLFAVFTFLVDGESMLTAVLRFTPLSETDRKRLLGTYVSVGRATIKGTLVIGIMQGGLAGLAFWVAGIQGAIFWGVVMTVLSIIPGIGTALVWVPAVVFLALDGQVVAAVGVADVHLHPVVEGLGVGGPGPRTHRVAGVVENWNPIPRFYDLNGKFRDSAPLVVPFRTAVSLESDINGSVSCWKPEDINSFADFLNSECVWIKFWAQLDSPEQLAAYADFLDGYAQEQKLLGRFERPIDNRLIDVMDWLEFRKVVSEDNVVLVGLSFLFLLVCLLNTVGLLLAKFIGGASLAGIRRALGASRGALFKQHLVEVSVIGLSGGLLGLVLAALGLKAVRGWFEDFEKITQLDWTMVAIALGLSLAASLAAGLYPTWRVCRIAPVRYLKTQ